MTTDERRRALEAIADEVRTCTRCRLHAGRTSAVPGEGHPDTEVAFVGEGPGFNEDQQGRPFVGAAGSFLNELLRSVGWRRDEVFITNVVKCRPPGNRDPEPDEIAACAPFLRRQLEVLDPALVVTLGRFSLNTFMPGARIGAVHGTTRPVDPGTGAADATAYAMYHPAVAFRQAALRDTLRADMAGVPQALLDSRARRGDVQAAAVDEPSETLPRVETESVEVATVELPRPQETPNGASVEVGAAATAPRPEETPRIEVAVEVPTAELGRREPDPGSAEQLGLF